MFDLITIGDALIDTFFVLDEKNSNVSIDKDKRRVCFNYADKMCIEHSTMSVGGNAANVAVGVRKLGHSTAIRTHLGEDINGHIVHSTLKKAKVNTSLIDINKKHETRYSVVLNYQTERTILSYYGHHVYSLPKLPKTEWLYFTSMGKGFEKIQNKLVAYMKKNPECKLAMNPGSYQMRSGLTKINSLLPKTDVLLLNKQEAERILKKKGTIKTLLRALHKKSTGIVVITDSTNGSYATNGANAWHMPIYPMNPLAKTGAGDAYTSGFLAAMIHGKTVPVAMQWGTANAGGVVQQFGAQHGLLTKSQLTSLVTKYKRIAPKTL